MKVKFIKFLSAHSKCYINYVYVISLQFLKKFQQLLRLKIKTITLVDQWYNSFINKLKR